MSAKVSLAILCAFVVVGGSCALAFGRNTIPLDQALKDGKVQAEIPGISGSTGGAILITVRRKVPEVLRLTLTPGLPFKSVAGMIRYGNHIPECILGFANEKNRIVLALR